MEAVEAVVVEVVVMVPVWYLVWLLVRVLFLEGGGGGVDEDGSG